MTVQRILYISVHAILEHDELKLFHELGKEFYSLGAYGNPAGHPLLPRPALPADVPYLKSLDDASKLFPRTEIPDAFLDHFDTIIVMHSPDILVQNWPRFRSKNVIWRSIGQSNRSVEEALAPLRRDGLKIVRYSPKEVNIPGYMGSDALIRFYKDPDELHDWNGNDHTVINFTQTLKGRRVFCHYDHVMEMIAGFPAKVYGSGNEDLGNLNGGELTWDLMKGKLRDSRVFVYTGTWPAQYTLSFMEALMTGIPIVAIGKRLAQEIAGVDYMDFYEVADMIQDGVNGFVSDDMSTLRSHIQQLLTDDTLARSISEKGRETALQLFAKDPIKEQWKTFFASL